MAEFGKRKGAGGARNYNRHADVPPDLAGAIAVAKTGKLPAWANTSPLQFVFVMLLMAAVFWWLFLPYGRDIIRDIRLSGTWQPAYDLKVTDGKCTRYQFILTTCEAKIRSLAEPNQAPLPVSYMMGISSGGGEILIPVRSTVDPSAVAIAYSAKDKLLNRTITFAVIALIVFATILGCLGMLLTGQYVGGTAHRSLMAGFEQLKARMENAQADSHATP